MGVSIDTGGRGGKKPLDAELNLVPFIDLLVCCICFLLITAVWTEMARIKVNQQTMGGPPKPTEVPPEMDVKVMLLIGEEGYTLTVGPDRKLIAKQGEVYNTRQLGEQLGVVHAERPDKSDITVAVEDGIRYRHIIDAMDVALGQKFSDIKVKDASVATP